MGREGKGRRQVDESHLCWGRRQVRELVGREAAAGLEGGVPTAGGGVAAPHSVCLPEFCRSCPRAPLLQEGSLEE